MTTYSIETVIASVGYIRDREITAIRHALGPGSAMYHDKVTEEFHLCWNLDADSMDVAIDVARTMHYSAKEATGIYVPETSLFAVRKVAQE